MGYYEFLLCVVLILTLAAIIWPQVNIPLVTVALLLVAIRRERA